MDVKDVLRYLRMVLLCVFVLVLFVGYNEVHSSDFITIQIKYHDEILAEYFCRVPQKYNLSNFNTLLADSLSKKGKLYLLNETNNIINRTLNRKKIQCGRLSVLYAPELENVTYRSVKEHSNIIYIYYNKNNSLKFITITKTINNPSILVSMVGIIIVYPLKRFTDYIITTAKKPMNFHYSMLIGISYLSITSFIYALMWIGSGFSLTGPIIILLLITIAFLFVIGIPALCVWIHHLISPSISEQNYINYYKIYSIFVFIVFSVMFMPIIGFFGIKTSIGKNLYQYGDMLTIGLSIIYLIPLTLLNLNRIKTIKIAYNIFLFISAISFMTPIIVTSMLYGLFSKVFFIYCFYFLVSIYLLSIAFDESYYNDSSRDPSVR